MYKSNITEDKLFSSNLNSYAQYSKKDCILRGHTLQFFAMGSEVHIYKSEHTV